LTELHECANFVMMWLLIGMCATEPMIWCMAVKDPADPEFPTEHCKEADTVMFYYSVCTMATMFIQWFMITDMAVFSNDLSAFTVVVKSVLAEIGRFMIALVFLLLTFGSAISVLDHDEEAFQSVPQSAIALFSITFKLYQDDYRGVEEPALIVTVFCYQTAVSILLLNLLIAQLQASYEFVYQDAMGFARLNRSVIISETIEHMDPKAKVWTKFVASCQFDKKLEFDEGDVGISGGMQVWESSRLHPIVSETIRRFGGSCSPEQPWPELLDAHETEDKFDTLERRLHQIMKKMVTAGSSNTDSGRQEATDRSGSSAMSSEGSESNQGSMADD